MVGNLKTLMPGWVNTKWQLLFSGILGTQYFLHSTVSSQLLEYCVPGPHSILIRPYKMLRYSLTLLVFFFSLTSVADIDKSTKDFPEKRGYMPANEDVNQTMLSSHCRERKPDKIVCDFTRLTVQAQETQVEGKKNTVDGYFYLSKYRKEHHEIKRALCEVKDVQEHNIILKPLKYKKKGKLFVFQRLASYEIIEQTYMSVITAKMSTVNEPDNEKILQLYAKYCGAGDPSKKQLLALIHASLESKLNNCRLIPRHYRLEFSRIEKVNENVYFESRTPRADKNCSFEEVVTLKQAEHLDWQYVQTRKFKEPVKSSCRKKVRAPRVWSTNGYDITAKCIRIQVL